MKWVVAFVTLGCSPASEDQFKNPQGPMGVTEFDDDPGDGGGQDTGDTGASDAGAQKPPEVSPLFR